MKRDEAEYRERFGDRTFEALFRFAKQKAQHHLLGRGVSPLDLAYLYGRPYGIDVSAESLGGDLFS
jgi:hypothetical protein